MHKPIPRWYALMSMFIGVAVSLGITLWYITVVDRQSDRDNEANDRKWCTLLVELDDAYSAGPRPTTEVGRRVADAIHQLRIDLGC